MTSGTDGAARDQPAPAADAEAADATEVLTDRGAHRHATAPPIRGVGIRTRIFLATAGLAVTTSGLAVAVATARANAVAERTIREGLGRVPALFASYRAAREEQLAARMSAIAAEAGTKALFGPADDLTRFDWARDVALAHGASTVFLFDRTGAVLTRSDRPPERSVGQRFADVPWVGGVLADQRPRRATIREADVLSMVVAVPVASGLGEERVLLGVLAASFALDEKSAIELKGLTRGDVGFFVDAAARGDPPRFEASATTPGLSASGDAAPMARMLGDPLHVEPLGRGEAVGPLDLGMAGDRRIAVALPLRTSRGETIGAVVVSRSRAEETAAFREIRDTLLAVGAGAFLLAVPLSLVIGRSVARPVEQLARSAQRIRDGHLDVALPSDRGGEVGALARAFAEMVEELREKAELERLVADLRVTSDAPTVALSPESRAALGAGGDAGDLSPAALVPGRRLGGRYEILDQLGRGGMATVFRALDRELDDEIALKVLDVRALPRTSLPAQALKQEIRLARRITHPNVVRTHDLGEADGLRFLTMEYVAGTTLRELLDRRGALELAPGVQIAKQLCRGLDAVHEAGIVHRDVKPQNVMVLPSGLVKLMDFGISFHAEDALAQAYVAGTPRYMSPEQAEGQSLDARSDVYSVGTVLFEVFTGRLPFDGADVRAYVEHRRHREPHAPRRFRPDLPEALERVVLACLARAPAERPASARDLYELLLAVRA